VCFNFLDEFLSYIKSVVTEDDHRYCTQSINLHVYIIFCIIIFIILCYMIFGQLFFFIETL